MKNKKIYILIPENGVAGGVESLYQLAETLNKLYDHAYVKFVNEVSDPVPSRYKKYNIKIIKTIEDSSENFLIMPEIYTKKIKEFKNIKILFFWLSVDNNKWRFKDFSNHNIIHLYQSEYANSYLIKNNVLNKLRILDYIYEQKYPKYHKENIVCYNPAKCPEQIYKLIKEWEKDIKFVPLSNMTREELLNNLYKSKIYIDFGHFPGRDRIPREACLYDNIIFTSRIGASKFNEDITIPPKYKLEHIDIQTSSIFKKALEDYYNIIYDFKTFKKIILQDKYNHETDVNILLNYLEIF